ncbi:MAG: zinc ribbon domain-containing protein [Armatimonadota bacterium]
MAERIQFVQDINDLSTDKGFQFEFMCNRCQTGYRTRFKPLAAGLVTGVLDAAGGLFGGFLNTAADIGERVRSAAWEKAHDGAYADAFKELQPGFVQCPKCNSWVCKSRCWNEKRGLCKGCAPDLGVEMSVAQSERSVEEIHRHACMADEDKPLGKETWKETIRASCPACGAGLSGKVKFCPECGEKIAQERFCAECGAKLAANAKFCPECGEKVAG